MSREATAWHDAGHLAAGIIHRATIGRVLPAGAFRDIEDPIVKAAPEMFRPAIPAA